MELVRIAIIGMGKMGQIRYETMKKHGGYEICAVCDVNTELLKKYSVSQYTDWHDCLDEIKPEAIVVCTYNAFITDIVCYALGQGIHVFSEKPPGKSLTDALKMQEAHATKKQDIVLKFGFNHRYHNSVLEAKALIDSGLLGDLVCARGVYGKAGSLNFLQEWRNSSSLAGGGILLDQGIHMLDLLRYFLGDFNHIQSSVNRLVWDGIDAEDSAFAILNTKDGKTASLHSSAIQWKHKFDMDIIFTEGYIALNGLLTASNSYGEERITYYRKDLAIESGKMGNPIEHTMSFDEDQSWSYEMAEFYDAIRNGIPVVNGTINDAVEIMRLIEAIYNNGN